MIVNLKTQKKNFFFLYPRDRKETGILVFIHLGQILNANFSVISAMYVNYDHTRKWSVLGHGRGQRLIGEKWAFFVGFTTQYRFSSHWENVELVL